MNSGTLPNALASTTINTDSGMGPANLMGAASGLAIAAYLIAVVYQGNLDKLGGMLLKEEGYLEFLVAIIALWTFHRFAPTSPVTDVITTVGLIGLAFKVAGNINFTSSLSAFASGQKNMAQTVSAIFGSSNFSTPAV